MGGLIEDNNNINMLSCPARNQWVSFRLVDESGEGASYSGLAFKLFDAQGQEHENNLDEEGFARLEHLYCGPMILTFVTLYSGGDKWYENLRDRKSYPLPLTELQLKAEQIPIGPRQPDGRTYLAEQRAQNESARFFRVEVSDLVEATKHLPDADSAWGPRASAYLKLAAGAAAGQPGIALEPNQHHVLEVKALRAYSPLFSLSPEFCALNAYHLAVMSTFSYAPFHKEPKDNPDYRSSPPPYSIPGTIGHVLREQLARQIKPTLFNTARYNLICEEVPYSKRLEVVPYDPDRYPVQKEGSTPESQHFFHYEDRVTDTQAFLTHNDKMILISIRGTQGGVDVLTDLDARLVQMEQGEGRAHRGFYRSFKAIKSFINEYMQSFSTGEQAIMICGHSLGGAIALLVAEWLRNTPAAPKVLLYTFGAPRAVDRTFVQSAEGLTHHRLINHNDLVVALPSPWMDAEWKVAVPTIAMLLSSTIQPLYGISLFLAGLLNLRGDPFEHHGQQYHFAPRQPGQGSATSLLWQPGCSVITEETCARLATDLALEGDMPKRSHLLRQIFALSEHSSDTGYSRAALTTLLRWNASLSRHGELFTREEINDLLDQLDIQARQVAAWEPGGFREFKREVRLRFRAQAYRLTDKELRVYYRQGQEFGKRLQEEQLAHIRRARRRLLAQSERPISAASVFGEHAQREDLVELVAEWRQIKQNQEAELLALPARVSDVEFV